MNRQSILKNLVLALAAAGVFGLSAAAVHRARAGKSASEGTPPALWLAGVPDGHEGPACRVGEEPVWHPSRADALGQVLAKARREALESHEKVVVLNTQGYNYGARRDVWQELDRVQREAQQGR